MNDYFKKLSQVLGMVSNHVSLAITARASTNWTTRSQCQKLTCKYEPIIFNPYAEVKETRLMNYQS